MKVLRICCLYSHVIKRWVWCLLKCPRFIKLSLVFWILSGPAIFSCWNLSIRWTYSLFFARNLHSHKLGWPGTGFHNHPSETDSHIRLFGTDSHSHPSGFYMYLFWQRLKSSWTANLRTHSFWQSEPSFVCYGNKKIKSSQDFDFENVLVTTFNVASPSLSFCWAYPWEWWFCCRAFLYYYWKWMSWPSDS